MRDLIAIEWMKLRRLATMKVILIIYAVTIPLIYFGISFLKMGPMNVIPDSAYQFPDCYNYVAYIASWFNLLVGVIIMVFTSNEIKYKTQRQNVIDGLSKRDVIISKFIVVFLFAVLTTLYVIFVGLIFGLIYGNPSEVFEGMDQIGAYFLSTLGYFSFAFFFASLIRMQALAIILYIFSTFIESIIGFIVAKEYMQFFPLRTFSELVEFPYEFPMATQMEAQAQGQPIPEQFMLGQGWSAVFAIGYIAIFVLITYWVIKRRDI